jgi:hypothetical protein
MGVTGRPAGGCWSLVRPSRERVGAWVGRRRLLMNKGRKRERPLDSAACSCRGDRSIEAKGKQSLSAGFLHRFPLCKSKKGAPILQSRAAVQGRPVDSYADGRR